MKINLVDNWRDCKKWISLHCMILASVTQGIEVAITESWIKLPDDLKNSLPHNFLSTLTLFLLFIGTFGRFINQSKNNIDSK